MFSAKAEISQAEALNLLQNFQQALVTLDQNVKKGIDGAGNSVGSMWRSDTNFISGILHALESIAYNQKFNPVALPGAQAGNTSTISNDAQEYLYKLICDFSAFGNGDKFTEMIKHYGANNQQLTQSLLSFQSFVLSKSNKSSQQQTMSTQAKVLTNIASSAPGPSPSYPKEKGLSYTHEGKKYSMHFRIPHNNINQAQKIINEMQRQNLPISIKGDIITVGPSQGVGTCGAYVKHEYDKHDKYTFIDIQFNNVTQRDDFIKLANLNTSGGLPNKITFIADQLEETATPTPLPMSNRQESRSPQTTKKEQHQPQPNPQFNEQMRNNIQACMTMYTNPKAGSWYNLSEHPKWEFGRSNHSQNIAFSTNQYQFELDKQNNIIVLDKHHRYARLTGQHHDNALRSALAELENVIKVQPLIMKIRSQIDKYEKKISEKPGDQENVRIWKDKIGILNEAITHLRGDNIDLVHAKNKYPLSGSGDGIIMTSDTTKLLDEVKEFKPYQPSRHLRR